MIERAGEGDHAPAAAPAVGGFRSDQAAERGRLADRTAGIRPRRAHCDPRRHRRGRSAGGTTGHQHGIGILTSLPGIFHRPIGRGHVGGAHRELIHVRLAEEHRAIAQQVRGHRALIGWDEGAEDLAASRCPHALGAEQILDRQRDTGQRAMVTGGQRLVGGPRLVDRLAVHDIQIGVQAGVQRLDPIQVGKRQFLGRERAGAQAIARGSDGEIGQRAHSTTFGTA